MHNKTLEQYTAEKRQLSSAMELPGVTEAERNIYAETIQRIHRAIEAMRQPAALPAPQPRIAATTGAPRQEGQPIPIRKIRADAPLMGHAPLASNPATFAPPPAPDRVGQEAPVIVADLTGNKKLVTIQWGYGKTEILTEGEARSRFTTCMRDLAGSRMARIGRLIELRTYITFSRATAYYRALAEFWSAAPTAAQLELTPMSDIRRRIFEMIVTASEVAQTSAE